VIAGVALEPTAVVGESWCPTYWWA
jgi:hypothetical protein